MVVDDSIVRGTTTRAMVAMLREAGAKEVHLRISSPPYRWPCFYGLDTGSRSELIAADLEVGEICDYLGADSLAYLSLDALKKATGVPGAGLLRRLPHRRLPSAGPGPVVEVRPRAAVSGRRRGQRQRSGGGSAAQPAGPQPRGQLRWGRRHHSPTPRPA